MSTLAAICGVMIVAFGLVTAGRAPSDVRLGIEVTSFVGGLILCFMAVVLARLARLTRALDARLQAEVGDGRLEETHRHSDQSTSSIARR